MELTWSEELIAKGNEQGLARGREQGLARGREQGQRTERRRIALSLLERRFGPLTARVRNEVEKHDAEQLDALIHGVISAETLADLDLD
ncbi:MAG: DUF4351 domain-containing protein [Acidobacteriota bacterium]